MVPQSRMDGLLSETCNERVVGLVYMHETWGHVHEVVDLVIRRVVAYKTPVRPDSSRHVF